MTHLIWLRVMNRISLERAFEDGALPRTRLDLFFADVSTIVDKSASVMISPWETNGYPMKAFTMSNEPVLGSEIDLVDWFARGMIAMAAALFVGMILLCVFIGAQISAPASRGGKGVRLQ